MARISTKLMKLERAKIIADRREEYIQQELQRKIDNNIVTPYQGRGDLTTYYIPSVLDAELNISVVVPTESLTKCLGGADEASVQKVGGTLTMPLQEAVAPQKGFANLYFRLKFIHKDTTPTASLTPWGTRVVKYYNKNGDQATREIPIGAADTKDILIKYNAIVSSPAPFANGIIQLISNDGDVMASTTV